MRKPRENKHNRVYHLISRIAHRAFFLDADERDRFIDVMKRSAAFSGVRLLAWCVMTNHVHILVYVPEPEELSDDALLSRMRTLYRKSRFAELKRLWDQLAARPGTQQFARFRGSFLKRIRRATCEQCARRLERLPRARLRRRGFPNGLFQPLFRRSARLGGSCRWS